MMRRFGEAMAVGITTAALLAGCSTDSREIAPTQRTETTTTIDEGLPFPETVQDYSEALRDLERRLHDGDEIKFRIGTCIYWQNLDSLNGKPTEWILIQNPATYKTDIKNRHRIDDSDGSRIPLFEQSDIFLSDPETMWYGMEVVRTYERSLDNEPEIGIRLTNNKFGLWVVDSEGGPNDVLTSASQAGNEWVTESGLQVMQHESLPPYLSAEEVAEYCYAKAAQLG